MIVYFYLFIFERKITVTKAFSLLIIILLFSFCTNRKEELNPEKIFSSKQYTSFNVAEKSCYLDSLSYAVPFFQNDSTQRDFLFRLSNEYYYLKNITKSLEISKRALILAQKQKDTSSVARAYFYIADCFEADRKDSAYYYYHKSEKLYSSQGQFEKVGHARFKKAYLLFFEGNYLESEIEISKALQLLKGSDNHQLLFSCYVLIGYNFEKLEEYDSALHYFNLSKLELDILKKSNTEFEQMNNYTANYSINLANVYDKKGVYDLSVIELESVKNDLLKTKWPNDYASVIGNLGYSKMQLGKLDEAYLLFTESLSLSRQNNQKNNVLYQLLNLGRYYIIINDTAMAISNLREANLIAEEIHSTDEIKKTLTLLSKIDYKNSAQYNQRYIVLSDSLTKAQRINRNKFARIEYETSILEDKNKLLHNERFYLAIISSFLLLCLLTFMVYRYFKNQKLALEDRKEKQMAEEELFLLLQEHQIELQKVRELEQNRISRELHDGAMNKIYGVRLQLGLLNDSNVVSVKEKRLTYVDMLQEIEAEIRSISHDLHTDSIEKTFDYTGLLILLLQKQNEQEAAQYELLCDTKIEWEQVSGLIKINFYRVIQEALQNISKYANAHHVTVSITLKNDLLYLLIVDDGKGFDVSAVKDEGIGLKNIKTRATLMKGKLSIDSAVGHGTRLDLVVGI